MNRVPFRSRRVCVKPIPSGEMSRMRIDTGGELRAFLQRAQGEFDRRLASPVKPQRKPIRLTGIEPREVMSREPTAVLIRGENFPPDAQVLFGGEPSPTPSVCRPDAGEIDVITGRSLTVKAG